VNEQEQKSILSICLLAAFADGAKDERERARIKEIADGLSATAQPSLAALYQDVLLKRITLDQAASALGTAELRQLAYEMAVCVCDADGAQTAAESAFLETLRRALGMDAAAAQSFEHAAEAIATVPLDEPRAGAPAPASAAPSPATATGPVVAAVPADSAALDKTILNYAILNGALELLPQSLATMAIIPLQMKMVYRIGKAHGYELDRGHIKDLLATLGVGLTSQYVEEFGRKLIGGLLRKVGGKLAGAIGRQATGSAMSFATTYALGHVAKSYYAGGRTLSMDRLRASFQGLLGEAQSLRARYAGEIEQKAKTLDVNQIVSLVRQQ